MCCLYMCIILHTFKYFILYICHNILLNNLYYKLIVVKFIYILEMISIEIKKAIYLRRNRGDSYGKIANEFGLSKATIQSIVASKGKICKKRGPKEKIPKSEKRKIMTYITDQKKYGIKVSCANIIESFELNVHRTTVLRTLRTLCYNYSNLPFRFILSPKAKQQRQLFAKKCIINNLNFNNVIFSDEKRFSLHGCESHYTWICSKQSPMRVRKVIRASGVMVWAMVMPNGLMSFRFMNGKQKADDYIKIIKEVVIPISKLNFGNKVIYQHDNCPIHSARKTKIFCESSNLEVSDWPAYSPDLNIIENLWQVISSKVYSQGSPKNIKELKSRIEISINDINENGSTIIHNLYGSIRSRLCEVLLRRGNRIKY